MTVLPARCASALWCVMTTLALAGCVPRPGGAPGTGPGATGLVGGTLCAGPQTQVTLSQVNISGSSASVVVNPGSAVVTPAGGGVRWSFAQNIYSFTSDGITFKPNQPAGPASAPPTGDATQYVWCFNATPPDQVWRYTIKFTANATPSKVWTCDPTIVNSDSTPAGAAQPLTVSCQ